MKIVTFTTLYPNAEKPGHGIFVETRLRQLVASGRVQARVVAPVPWFPSQHPRFGQYARFARVPHTEQRHGLEVQHPRYLLLPKVGMSSAPFMLAQAGKKALGRMLDEGYDFDMIDAHYFYPDGVAAAMLGKYFNKPVTITARGSDISLLPQYRVPRRLIRWAVERADGLVTVCQALKDELVALGVDADRITPLRNGIDLQLFQPGDHAQQRADLGLDGYTLLCVGHLVPLKGQHLVIEALSSLPDTTLLIAGDGVERKRLEQLAVRQGVAGRVRFLGAVPQSALPAIYGAADALVLASSREGWANVLLEAMACGTPAIASRVWGTPEVVAAPQAGLLMQERSAAGIVQAVHALRQAAPERTATRRYAEQFSWDATTAGQLRLFDSILQRRAQAALAVMP